MSGKRLVYVLLNSPVGSRPYVVNIFQANPYITAMFEANKEGTISKRNIERLGEFPPCGARFQLLPYDLRENFFTERWERDGPDLFDRVHAIYMQEQAEKRQLK